MFDPDEFLDAFPGDISKITDLRSALKAVYKLGLKENADKLGKREKGIAEMMADLRSCADFLGNDGYTRWRNTLLNVEQSIAAPETYRRLP